MRNTILDAILGSIAGAVVIVAFDLALSWMVQWPRQTAFLIRDAVLGTVLGGLTYASVRLVQRGRNRSAGRLCIAGGFPMALLMLWQIAFSVSMLNQALTSGGKVKVSVPGPEELPVQLRGILASVMLNMPLLWAILLVGSGVWLSTKKRVPN